MTRGRRIGAAIAAPVNRVSVAPTRMQQAAGDASKFELLCDPCGRQRRSPERGGPAALW